MVEFAAFFWISCVVGNADVACPISTIDDVEAASNSTADIFATGVLSISASSIRAASMLIEAGYGSRAFMLSL